LGDLSLNLEAGLGVKGGNPRKSKYELSIVIFFGVLIGSIPKKQSTADQLGLGTVKGE